MPKCSNLDSKSGTKTDRATEWSIPVVNHTWLEDCFVNWRNLSVGHEKYVRFSPTCDCSVFLGGKGMGRKVILEDAEQDIAPQGLAVPTGSIREVEEAIAVDENDLGTSSQHPNAKGGPEDVEMVDGDAPDVDEEMEVDVPPRPESAAKPSPTPMKRRRSGNSKPSAAEVTDSETPGRSALDSRQIQSQAEVAVPPRPGFATPKKDGTSSTAKVRRLASHTVVAAESPVSAKKQALIRARTHARKSATVFETEKEEDEEEEGEDEEEEGEDEEEEEERTSSMRPPLKKTQKRKRNESESDEEHEQLEQPTPGPSKPKSTKATQQRRAQDSSPPPAYLDDIPSRGRRSAAQKAGEKLKDIMPDVINFEKEMRRGNVVSEWDKANTQRERSEKKAKEKEKSKENAGEKLKERASKKRRSDVRYVTPALTHHPTLPYDLECSAKEEEEEGDDVPSTSKTKEVVVRIVTTKVQVPEDTKKVRSMRRNSLPHRCLLLPPGSDKTRCQIHRQAPGMHTFDRRRFRSNGKAVELYSGRSVHSPGRVAHQVCSQGALPT